MSETPSTINSPITSSPINRLSILAALVVANIVACSNEVGQVAVAASSSDATSSFVNSDTQPVGDTVTSINPCQVQCDPNHVLFLDCPAEGPLSDGPFADLVNCSTFEIARLACECLSTTAKISPGIKPCWSEKGTEKVEPDCIGTTVFPEAGTLYTVTGNQSLKAVCRTTGESVESCTVRLEGPGAIELSSGNYKEGTEIIPLYP